MDWWHWPKHPQKNYHLQRCIRTYCGFRLKPKNLRLVLLLLGLSLQVLLLRQSTLD
jgi:hypothetical protein